MVVAWWPLTRVFTLSPAAAAHFLHRTGGAVTAVTWPRDICMDPGNIALSASITHHHPGSWLLLGLSLITDLLNMDREESGDV